MARMTVFFSISFSGCRKGACYPCAECVLPADGFGNGLAGDFQKVFQSGEVFAVPREDVFGAVKIVARYRLVGGDELFAEAQGIKHAQRQAVIAILHEIGNGKAGAHRHQVFFKAEDAAAVQIAHAFAAEAFLRAVVFAVDAEIQRQAADAGVAQEGFGGLGAVVFIAAEKIDAAVFRLPGFGQRVVKIEVAGSLKAVLWVFFHVGGVKHQHAVKQIQIAQNIGKFADAVPLEADAEAGAFADLGDDAARIDVGVDAQGEIGFPAAERGKSAGDFGFVAAVFQAFFVVCVTGDAFVELGNQARAEVGVRGVAFVKAEIGDAVTCVVQVFFYALVQTVYERGGEYDGGAFIHVFRLPEIRNARQ